ncbi:MAG: hypothetical protein Q9159_005648 [Coniocarpon cinnabarinum]
MHLPPEHVRWFSRGPSPPRGCGKRLIPHLVDDRAKASHPRPLFSIHVPASNTFRDVSYAEYANAVNRAAHWIISGVGRSTRFDTLVYLGPSDLRYQILTLASHKTGHVLFAPSPRNNSDAFQSLLDECDATTFLTAASTLPTVTPIGQLRPGLSVITVPELDELLDKQPVEPIHFDKTWEEARFDPFVQIHTSGSTGTPKLITVKHGNFTAVDAMQAVGGNELGARIGELRFGCTFPLFHVAGFIYGLAIPMLLDSTSILPPAGPLTAEVANHLHVAANADYSLLPPSIVIDLAKNEEYLDTLSRMKGIAFAGGPLPEDIGRIISQHTDLAMGWGTSEYQAAPQLRKEKEDWAYFHFNELEGGLEFREREEGLFEMVHVRNAELDLVQPVFITFPHLQEFCTKDLFIKHPTKPGLWKYGSRLDDLIVFSNGEKFNPTTMEGAIMSAPDVKGCVIIGQGRFQACALIEPKDTSQPPDQLLDRVWPVIQRANEHAVKQGRIAKELVFFTKPEKPLARAAKGTIQRAASNKLYAEEVNRVYESMENGRSRDPNGRKPSTKHLAIIDLSSPEATVSSLTRFLAGEADLHVSDMADDFFSMGMDSLQLISLVRAINAARPSQPLDTKHVYEHPSIQQLSAFLHSDDVTESFQGYDSDDEDMKASWVAMDQTFNDYTKQVDNAHGKRSSRREFVHSSNAGPIFQPDGGLTAWLQVLASFLININNWGLVNTFGVFQAYYETTLIPGQSVFDISWVGTLQGALLLTVGVISGPLFDLGYFRAIVIAASTGVVFALMMLSLATEYYQILLSQGVLLGICSGLLYIPSVALMPVYFKHRRGLALGVATCGGSIGGVLYPIAFQHLLQSVGFGWATRIIGFVALGTLGCAVIILKPLGPRTRRQLVDVRAFTDVSYLAFSSAAFLVFAALLVPFFLAPTFDTQQLHTTSDIKNYWLPLLNVGQFFGRLLPSIYSDYNHRFMGPEGLMFFAEFAAGAMGFAWLGVKSVGGFVPWLLIYGFLSGMITTLPAIVLPFICPNMATYGTRLGMLYACAGVGLLVSTPIAAALNTRTGNFHGSMYWIGAACVAAALSFAIAGWDARKRRLLFEMGDRRGKARRTRRARRAERTSWYGGSNAEKRLSGRISAVGNRNSWMQHGNNRASWGPASNRNSWTQKPTAV